MTAERQITMSPEPDFDDAIDALSEAGKKSKPVRPQQSRTAKQSPQKRVKETANATNNAPIDYKRLEHLSQRRSVPAVRVVVGQLVAGYRA